MNIGFYSCFVLAVIFGVMTLVFALLGKKAAILISDFNSLSKIQQEMYDVQRMSKDQRNSSTVESPPPMHWIAIYSIRHLFHGRASTLSFFPLLP